MFYVSGLREGLKAKLNLQPVRWACVYRRRQKVFIYFFNFTTMNAGFCSQSALKQIWVTKQLCHEKAQFIIISDFIEYKNVSSAVRILLNSEIYEQNCSLGFNKNGKKFSEIFSSRTHFHGFFMMNQTM